MKNKTPFKWEVIDIQESTFNVYRGDITKRAKVIGGWVVNTIFMETGQHETASSQSMVFIPDKNHEWEI